MKGIKCTSNEVNAILAGDKGQIRLVIKPQPREGFIAKLRRNKQGNLVCMEWVKNTDQKIRLSGLGMDICKPPHQIGDLVFVKEDFCEKVDQETFEFLGDYHYRASCDFDVFMMGDDGFSIENKDGSERLAWKPAQHMKQHQSRITLRIKDISVERLADISEDDCWKEGVGTEYHDYFGEDIRDPLSESDYSEMRDYKSAFKEDWNATHKKPEEKWEANPWIWKIEFEVVK